MLQEKDLVAPLLPYQMLMFCRDLLYPKDLRQALLRRVQRNLALRALPLAVLQGDAEAGSTILPGKDLEVRRLEGPFRRLLVG